MKNFKTKQFRSRFLSEQHKPTNLSGHGGWLFGSESRSVLRLAGHDSSGKREADVFLEHLLHVRALGVLSFDSRNLRKMIWKIDTQDIYSDEFFDST